MEFIRGRHNIRPRHRGCVVTIGNFDGVHRGHQAILEQVAVLAEAAQQPTLLVTFEPHPKEFFSASNAPPRLTRFREKMRILSNARIDRVLLMRFNDELSSMAPLAFVEDFLVDSLGASAVVVGDDFRFGRRAEGGVELLREAGDRLGFQVHLHATLEVQGSRASSSRVRDALAAGDLDLAGALLGRPYDVLGRVAYGRQLGRTIGFPTANIELKRVATPLSGVFAVRLHGFGGTPLDAMANLGTRPTVDGTRLLLEVHVFDFDQDFYGYEVRVEFVSKLREERKFDGIDALKAQLARDAVSARDALAVP